MRHVIQCVIICLFTVQVIRSLNVGDICVDPKTEKPGFCKPILKCPEAIQDIKRGVFPLTCGFLTSAPDPIICCLYEQNSTFPGDTKPSTTTPTDGIIFGDVNPTATTALPSGGDDLLEEKISLKKCKEFGKYVYAEQASPTLMIGHFVTVDTCAIEGVISRSAFAVPRQFPHEALIGYQYLKIKRFKCGGTLISERHVLTSVQCTYLDMYGFAKFVRLGIADFSDRNNDLQDVDVLEIVKHPDYDEVTLQNDIALLKLVQSAILGPYVRPACLPLSETLIFKQVLVSGWGTANSAENNDYVLKGQVLEVRDCCSSIFRDKKCKSNQFCVELLDSHMCVADGGAPAVIIHPDVYCSYTLVGVVSSWDSCSPSGKRPVLTRVSKYIDWIEDNIWT